MTEMVNMDVVVKVVEMFFCIGIFVGAGIAMIVTWIFR